HPLLGLREARGRLDVVARRGEPGEVLGAERHGLRERPRPEPGEVALGHLGGRGHEHVVEVARDAARDRRPAHAALLALLVAVLDGDPVRVAALSRVGGRGPRVERPVRHVRPVERLGVPDLLQLARREPARADPAPERLARLGLLDRERDDGLGLHEPVGLGRGDEVPAAEPARERQVGALRRGAAPVAHERPGVEDPGAHAALRRGPRVERVLVDRVAGRVLDRDRPAARDAAQVLRARRVRELRPARVAARADERVLGVAHGRGGGVAANSDASAGTCPAGVPAAMPACPARESRVTSPARTRAPRSATLPGPACVPPTAQYQGDPAPGSGGGPAGGAAGAAAGWAGAPRDCASCWPMAAPMPIPAPSPSPSPAPPGFAAAASIAFAAWNFVYWSRFPTTAICVRLSSAASTSGGNETFSRTKRRTDTPYPDRSSQS